MLQRVLAIGILAYLPLLMIHSDSIARDKVITKDQLESFIGISETTMAELAICAEKYPTHKKDKSELYRTTLTLVDQAGYDVKTFGESFNKKVLAIYSIIRVHPKSENECKTDAKFAQRMIKRHSTFD